MDGADVASPVLAVQRANGMDPRSGGFDEEEE